MHGHQLVPKHSETKKNTEQNDQLYRDVIIMNDILHLVVYEVLIKLGSADIYLKVVRIRQIRNRFDAGYFVGSY